MWRSVAGSYALRCCGLLSLGACAGPSPVVGRDSDGVAGHAGTGSGFPDPEGAGAPGSQRQSVTVMAYTGQLRAVEGDEPTFKCLPGGTPMALAGVPDILVHRVALDGCACDASGYRPPTPGIREEVQELLANEGFCNESSVPACSEYCVCEELPAEGSAKQACSSGDAEPDEASGWCYVARSGELGNPELVSECPPTSPGVVRLFGDHSEGLLFHIVSRQSLETETTTPELHLRLGAACVPEIERSPTFHGYATNHVAVNYANPACGSSVCLVNHMQGRVSCPYGQTEDELAASSPGCHVPWSTEPVTVPVDPQRLSRTASSAATCSCRCNGPGEGPFCVCPGAMECVPLIAETGSVELDIAAGSYCIPRGTAFSPQGPDVPSGTCVDGRASGEDPCAGASLPY
jgi:hypothetical protein